MPVDDDISAVSKSDLRTRLNECLQARAAERLAQREAMMAGAAATTDNDISFYAAQTHASETAIQKLDKDMASLGTAMRKRASPAKTREQAEPTSKSQAADQKEPSFGAANASTAPTDRPIKEHENTGVARAAVSRTAPSSPTVRGPPAPNVSSSRPRRRRPSRSPRLRRSSNSTWPTAQSRTRTGRSLWTPRSRAPLRLARCTRPGLAQW